MTHWRLGRSASNSRPIAGMATYRMVLSRTGMITDTMTTAAANHRRGSRCGSLSSSGLVDGVAVRRLTYRPMRGTGLTRAMTWGVGPRVIRRTPDGWPERSYTRLKLEPYTEVIGAEVRGIDL